MSTAPCKKVSFIDEQTALFYVEKLKKTSRRKVVPHRAYLCEKCFTWHLSSSGKIREETNQKGTLEITLLHQQIQKLKNRVSQLEAESKNKTKKINSLHDTIYELNKASGRFSKSIELSLKNEKKIST